MKFLSALILTAALAACRPESDVANGSAKLPDTLTYRYHTLKKASDNVVKQDSSTDTTIISITYPVFGNKVLDDFVESALAKSDDPDANPENLEGVADDFINAFDNFFRHNKKSPRIWASETEMKVLRQTKDLINFKEEYYSYTGGAHGIQGINFYNFSKKKAAALKLEDIVKSDSLEKFTAVAEKIFRQNEKLAPNESLKENYFFDEGKFQLNNNFLLSDKEIVFLFNQYEIRAYAYGTTTLSIPFSMVSQLIRPEYLPEK